MIKRNLRKAQLALWVGIHRLPSWIIALWQRWKFKKLALWAHQNVPLYRDLWRGINYPYVNIEKLPITQKVAFQIKPIRDCIPTIFGKYINSFVWHHTSGSTGEPLTFVPASHSMPRAYAFFCGYRFLWWKGISYNDFIKKIKIAKIRMAFFSSPLGLFIPVADFFSRREEAIEKLMRFNNGAIDVIESYPTILVELAQYLEQKKLKNKFKITYALSYGEMLTSFHRGFIERTLNCEVYNKYGLEEFGGIGIECRFHEGFHLNCESFILETVDDRGLQTTPGEIGRIVITDLNNFIMPFIRYDTGDRGRILKERCRCGLGAFRFTIEGRLGSFLAFPKRKVHHFEIAQIFNTHHESIHQYQVRRIGPAAIELLVVPNEQFSNSTMEKIKNDLRLLVGEEVEVSVTIAAKPITRLVKGKARAVVDYLADNALYK